MMGSDDWVVKNWDGYVGNVVDIDGWWSVMEIGLEVVGMMGVVMGGSGNRAVVMGGSGNRAVVMGGSGNRAVVMGGGGNEGCQ